MSPRALTLVVIVAIAGLISWESFYVIKQYERAVVLRFGQVVNADVKPGLHVKAPFIDNVRIYDGRLQTMDAKAQRLENRLRNAIGARTMHEVVSGQRDELMDEIRIALNKVAQKEMGIKVVDVRLKAIDLPPQVSDSVFDRMRSEREKEAQEHRAQGKEQAEGIQANADREKRVILADAQRDADKIRGDGDATAAAIYAKAYGQDPEFYAFYRSLEAYKESLGKSGDMLVLEPDSDFFRYLNKSK